MKLYELNVGEVAMIDKIEMSDTLKERLSSLGVIERESISLERTSLFKNTLQFKSAGSYIALRKSEAACIEVHRVA